MIATVVFLLGKSIASVMDIRTREIPIWFFPILSIVLLLLSATGISKTTFIYSLSGCITLFLFTFTLAKLGSIGGADVLASGLIGAYFGIPGFYALCAAYILCIPQAYIYSKKDNRTYPFIPYMLAGSILIMLVQIL